MPIFLLIKLVISGARLKKYIGKPKQEKPIIDFATAFHHGLGTEKVLQIKILTAIRTTTARYFSVKGWK
jgi:hypothetical protein